jgi:hypothetical protein
MKMLAIASAILLLAVVFASPRVARARLLVDPTALVRAAQDQARDPIAVLQAMDAAMNAHDVDAAVALFADDGVYLDTFPAPKTTGRYVGKAPIRAYFQTIFAFINNAQSSNFRVAGDYLTAANQQSFNDPNLPPGFPQPIESHIYVVIQNGKIQSFTIDNNAGWLARRDAVLGPTPGMPTTGAPSPTGALIVLVLAGLLVLLGLSLRVGHGHVR